MITREKEPANLEMPFSRLDGAITPTEQFYLRSHFPVPQIDLRSWRLRIEGKVARSLELSYEQLRKFGARTIQATIECAGNSRVFLVPKVKGVQWELGAVGNAEWTGVPLREVLEKAGASNNAREVILEGADSGSIAEPPRPAGKIHFARSLPIEKAIDDVLLAYEMNGAPLTPAHGFPLRAIVPGWYGMASIKWLQRIVVTDEPFNGYHQTVDYAFWEPGENGPVLRPLTEMQVKAEIARPQNGEVVPANENYKVRGAAWSSGTEITKVELSTDGGNSWDTAALIGGYIPNAWRLWEFQWRTPAAAGSRTLLARATDSVGRTQPNSRDANRGTYMINHCLPIEIEVR
jgi:DMSO/TMAO reductase YedYZ molybdopterin-dependent catalytic subunit